MFSVRYLNNLHTTDEIQQSIREIKSIDVSDLKLGSYNFFMRLKARLRAEERNFEHLV
jgi:hypothetical protein